MESFLPDNTLNRALPVRVAEYAWYVLPICGISGCLFPCICDHNGHNYCWVDDVNIGPVTNVGSLVRYLFVWKLAKYLFEFEASGLGNLF